MNTVFQFNLILNVVTIFVLKQINLKLNRAELGTNVIFFFLIILNTILKLYAYVKISLSIKQFSIIITTVQSKFNLIIWKKPTLEIVRDYFCKHWMFRKNFGA